MRRYFFAEMPPWKNFYNFFAVLRNKPLFSWPYIEGGCIQWQISKEIKYSWWEKKDSRSRQFRTRSVSRRVRSNPSAAAIKAQNRQPSRIRKAYARTVANRSFWHPGAVRSGSVTVPAISAGGMRRERIRQQPIIRSARTAASRSLWQSKRHRNTAPRPVIRKQGRRPAMREDMFRSVLGYLSAMAQAKALLHQGIITQREYAHFDTMFTKKYGLSLDSIFREISW